MDDKIKEIIEKKIKAVNNSINILEKSIDKCLSEKDWVKAEICIRNLSVHNIRLCLLKQLNDEFFYNQNSRNELCVCSSCKYLNSCVYHNIHGWTSWNIETCSHQIEKGKKF